MSQDNYEKLYPRRFSNYRKIHRKWNKKYNLPFSLENPVISFVVLYPAPFYPIKNKLLITIFFFTIFFKYFMISDENILTFLILLIFIFFCSSIFQIKHFYSNFKLKKDFLDILAVWTYLSR